MITKKVKIGDLESMGFKTKPKTFWSDLRKSLKEGYRPTNFKNGYIRVTKNNLVMDGNHRLYILKELYGEDYEIDVRVSGLTLTFFGTIIWWFNENVSQKWRRHPRNVNKDFYTTETYEDNYELRTVRLVELKEFNKLRNLNYIKRKRPASLLKKSQWSELENSLLEHQYKPYEFGFIKIDRDRKIIDGYKRIYFLLNKYGNNFEIEVMSLKRIVKKPLLDLKIFLLLLLILTLILIIF